MQDFFDAQLRAEQRGGNYAVVTIVKTGGSTPRTSGKMLVYPDGTTECTIGGGAVERAAAEEAVKCIERGENAFREYDLAAANKNLGMICGGNMSVLIEVFTPKPLLIMCGAGHVGGALIDLAHFLGFSVTLVDNRPDELIAERIEKADNFVHVEDFYSELAALSVPAGAYFVIATYGHSCDGEALGAALQKNAAYVGMIGSHVKIDTLFARLKDKGVTMEQLEAVYTPIGLDVGSETPEEIALAIMAEIMAVRNHGSGEHLRDKKRRGEK